MKRFMMLMLLLLMAGLLVACGSGDDSDSNTSDTSIADLPQSIQFADAAQSYTLTVNYPDGWFSSNGTDLGIGLSNDQATMQSLLAGESAVPAENVISGNILFTEFSRLENVSINADMPATEILPAYTVGVFGVGINADDVEEVEVNGETLVIATIEGNGSAVQFTLKVVDGGIVVAFMGTIEGGLDQFRDIILGMVAEAEVELHD